MPSDHSEFQVKIQFVLVQCHVDHRVLHSHFFPGYLLLLFRPMGTLVVLAFTLLGIMNGFVSLTLYEKYIS